MARPRQLDRSDRTSGKCLLSTQDKGGISCLSVRDELIRRWRLNLLRFDWDTKLDSILPDLQSDLSTSVEEGASLISDCIGFLLLLCQCHPPWKCLSSKHTSRELGASLVSPNFSREGEAEVSWVALESMAEALTFRG